MSVDSVKGGYCGPLVKCNSRIFRNIVTAHSSQKTSRSSEGLLETCSRNGRVIIVVRDRDREECRRRNLTKRSLIFFLGQKELETCFNESTNLIIMTHHLSDIEPHTNGRYRSTGKGGHSSIARPASFPRAITRYT